MGGLDFFTILSDCYRFLTYDSPNSGMLSYLAVLWDKCKKNNLPLCSEVLKNREFLFQKTTKLCRAPFLENQNFLLYHGFPR